MSYELRPAWRSAFNFNWKFGLFLIVIVCIPRFILVLYANVSGNYGAIGMVMVVSALAPFIFLSRQGRQSVGMTWPGKLYPLLAAFIAGLALSFLLYIIGKELYGTGENNWYVYIGRSYKIPSGIKEHDKLLMFIVVALTGMVFSPVGEELFFRGIVHAAFARPAGEKRASVSDSTAFALTHLSHFGLVYSSGHWHLLIIPGLVWVAGMFMASQLFFLFKNYAASITGAIACHAAFYLGMTYCIFYLL
jgi:membrane protease YdiL (CAAX protease family)